LNIGQDVMEFVVCVWHRVERDGER
jgi:hypothetical protein